MADNTTTGITIQDGSTPAMAERYLVKRYLKQGEFNTPLTSPKYTTGANIPRRNGQWARFHRRNTMREPQKVAEGVEPLSGTQLSYERVEAPIEYISDYIEIPTDTRAMSWMDLMRDARFEIDKAVRRSLNRHVQSALVAGRHESGVYDAAGVLTTPFWTNPQPTFSIYGQSFTFNAAPTYYVNGRANFGALQAGDRFTMKDFTRIVTRLRNSGAIPVGQMMVAVISHAIEEDLMEDDKYFQRAIRESKLDKKIATGHIADHAGIHWIVDDEPWVESSSGTENVLAPNGDIHTAHIFGMDAYGWIRLGGKNASTPTFKVQDVTKTNALVTVGYRLPFQTLVMNQTWCANLKGPVSTPGNNG